MAEVLESCPFEEPIGKYEIEKAEKPLTEQEYLQTCTTEQLAEYILNVWLDGALNVNAEFGLNEAQIEKHKGYIVERLKQPHSNE